VSEVIGLKSGSLVLVNLTARVKDTGEVIETTVEEDAKKLGVYDESKRYEPKLICVGEGWVLKGVDEALLSTEVGRKITIDIPPEKAFGLRDPNKVRRIPIRKFGEKASELSVGDEVTINGRIGLIRFIGSGRAQVDFNHKYAGKVIIYDIEPVKELVEPEEKVLALIRRRLPVAPEKLPLKIEGGEAVIKLPPETYLTEGLQIIKRGISTDVFKYVPDIGRVLFIETYESPKKEAEKPSEEAKPEAIQEEAEGPG